MNKLKSASILGLFALSLSANAQNVTTFCGTSDSTQRVLFQRPDIKANIEQLDKFTAEFIKNKQKTSSTQKIVIPIVFHIIHNNGPENVSKAQVLDAVNVINTDYHKLNADTSETIAQFKGIAAKVDIEFRIATIDPNGNCTEGITRTLSTQTTNAGEGVKDLISWDTKKYLNVWIVKSIGSGAGGYAYLPGTAPSPSHEGVILRNDQFGSIGTTPSGSDLAIGSLTHEIGHFFNLNHTWGHTNTPGVSTNCTDDDGVTDTPNCQGAQGCDLYGDNACGPLANEQNYMDYAGCYTMFTEGQKTRMLAALNSTVGSRSNLWSQANLLATGTEDGHNIQVCIPSADFYASKTKVCSGVNIQYYDNSYNAAPTSYQWVFPGGTPATSTDPSPIVKYDTDGLYNVTLIAGTSAGNDTTTKPNYVRIGQSITPFTYPFSETFATPNFTDNGWYIDNVNADRVLWAKSTTSYSGGSGSMKLNAYSTLSTTSGTIDALTSPPIDFTNVTAPVCTFYEAYASRSTATNSDALKIYYSINCGETWGILANLKAATLSSSAVSSTAFTPTTAAQWKQQTLKITSLAGKTNVIFKFEYNNAGTTANNLYLDDINWGSAVTGIAENALSNLNLELFPNPTDKESTLSFNLEKSNVVKIEIFDMLGRSVANVLNEKLESGNHKVALNTIDVKGIYFVKMNIGTQQIVSKLVIN